MAKRGTTRVMSTRKRLRVTMRTIGLVVLALGALMALIGHEITTSQANAAQIRKLPVFGEKTWGKWLKEDQGIRFPTTQQVFALGQTVTVSNDVSISVDSVDRNWAPPFAWQAPPIPAGGQDDMTGKEVMLVHFTVTNLGNAPLLYSDAYFALVRAGGHEQRVAAINELTGDQYGSFGHPAPWLLPGVTTHTFVPFLVNPGEQPRAFAFYRFTEQWLQPLDATTGRHTPVKRQIIGTARILFALSSPGKVAGGATPSAATPAIWTPDSVHIIGPTDVYSPSPA